MTHTEIINAEVSNAARHLRDAIAALMSTADTTVGRSVEFRDIASRLLPLRRELLKLHLS